MLAAKERSIYEAPAERSAELRRRSAAVRTWSLFDKVSAVVCLCLCVGTAWFIADRGAAISRLNYQVDQMETQIRQVQAENQTLANQVDQLMRPSRILGIALGKLHMQYAQPVQIPAGHQ